MALHAKAARQQALDPIETSVELINLAATLAQEVMMMRLAGCLITRRLAGQLDLRHLHAKVSQRAVHGSNAKAWSMPP